jgi:PAS domain S-box-containing protein
MIGPEQKTSKTKQHPPSLSVEERFRLLSESLTDYAFITFDQENRITSWSAGAEKLLGWSEDEVLGECGAILFTSEDRERGEVEKEIDQALHYGRAEDDRWHMRKDGSRFWGSGVMTAVGDESGRTSLSPKCCATLRNENGPRRRSGKRRRSSVRPWR